MSRGDQQTSKQASPSLTSTAELIFPTQSLSMAGSPSLTAQSHQQQRPLEDENRESSPAPEPSIARTDTAQSCIVVGSQAPRAEASSPGPDAAISPDSAGGSTPDDGPPGGENSGPSNETSIGGHQTPPEAREGEHQKCALCHEVELGNGKTEIMCLRLCDSRRGY